MTVKNPLNLSRLRVYGPGVGSENVFVDQRTSFTVDSQNVGSNEIVVKIIDPNGKHIEAVDISNDAMHSVSYIPVNPGKHIVWFFI